MGLRHVLLLFLRLLGAGFGLVILIVILTRGIRIGLLFCIVFGVVLLIIFLIGVIPQLIAIAEIVDDLTGKLGKAFLVGQQGIQIAQRIAGLLFDIALPQLHHVACGIGQVAPCCQMADQIPCSNGKRRL